MKRPKGKQKLKPPHNNARTVCILTNIIEIENEDSVNDGKSIGPLYLSSVGTQSKTKSSETHTHRTLTCMQRTSSTT